LPNLYNFFSVVIAILDAFHFDLRQCQEIELTASITALNIKSAEDDKKKKQEKREGDESIMEEEENNELDEAMEEEEGDEKPEDAEECPEEVKNPTPGNIQPEQTMEGRQKIYAIITRKLIPRLRNLLNPQVRKRE
jgi:TATA-binding protein-associated factor Taf7